MFRPAQKSGPYKSRFVIIHGAVLAARRIFVTIVTIFMTITGAVPSSEARTPDLTATYAHIDTIDLKIDLHLPPPLFDSLGHLIAGPAHRPLMLWMHGGGWRGGTRGDANPALAFLDSGFVVASIDYRFSQQAKWPAQIHDAQAAVRWVRTHADALRLDTARIVAWGTSAGGYLATFLGVTTPADSLEGTVPIIGADTSGARPVSSQVRAVVSYFGPTNFLEYVPRRWSKYSSVGQLLGCAVNDCLDLARRASPVTYASPDDRPFFITHGTADSTVPFSQAVTLDSALRASGVPVMFLPVPGADHGGPGFRTDSMHSMVAGFLNRVLADDSTQIPVSHRPLVPPVLSPKSPMVLPSGSTP